MNSKSALNISSDGECGNVPKHTSTPRTDALLSGIDSFGNIPTMEDRYQRMCRHARELERENIVLRAALEFAIDYHEMGVKPFIKKHGAFKTDGVDTFQARLRAALARVKE